MIRSWLRVRRYLAFRMRERGVTPRWWQSNAARKRMLLAQFIKRWGQS